MDFPNTPAVGDLFILGDRSWIWNGFAWDQVGGGGGSGNLTIDSEPPATPTIGDRWLDPDTGVESIWVPTDDDIGAWFSPAPGSISSGGGSGGGAVTSVNGQTGDVTITKANISGLQTDLDSKEPAIAAGTTAQFLNGSKVWTDFQTTVRAALLTGISFVTNAAIGAGDSVLAALGKLQAQITGIVSSISAMNTLIGFKADAASPTMTGVVSLNGSVRQPANAVAALAIDCAAGNYFTKTISANSTLTFSNVPASGTSYSCVLELTHTSGTLTHPTGTIFSGGTAPTLTTGKVHLIYYVTRNAGTTWRCSILKDFAS